MVRKSVLYGLAALAGGLIMIGAMLLPWAAVGFDGVVTDYTGLELFTDGRFSSSPQHFISLLAAAFGVVIVIGEAVAVTSPNKYVFRAAAFVAVIGLIGAIVAAVFQLWDLPAASGGHLSYGAAVAICGGILALLTGMNQLRLCAYGQ